MEREKNVKQQKQKISADISMNDQKLDPMGLIGTHTCTLEKKMEKKPTWKHASWFQLQISNIKKQNNDNKQTKKNSRSGLSVILR